MTDVLICDGLVCEAFPNSEVFGVDKMFKLLDPGVMTELDDADSLDATDQNEVRGESACAGRKCSCTILKSRRCCWVGGKMGLPVSPMMVVQLLRIH